MLTQQLLLELRHEGTTCKHIVKYTENGGIIMVASDIQIAQEAHLDSILAVAKKVGLEENDLELYGKHKAKLTYDALTRIENQNEAGRLILVTAINPTAAGEGKSTVTVGLGDALTKSGRKTMIALREPSLGPVFGLKGGATGGGYAQVIPMEDINLHFTGDFHAITSANNLLSAMLDNHMQQGNLKQIDGRRIVWKRVVDLNDRALRQVVIGLGGPFQGVPRQDGFDITVASEIMAIICLARDIDDLKTRIGNIVVGYDYARQPITAHDIGAEGALTVLLKDALKPNLVQTLEHTPALVHGGPFANIAHGCNSIMATKSAFHLADYTVTEAGFGADLGAEKFLDIKVPQLGKVPDAIVIVATIRALKLHGGANKNNLKEEDVLALEKGFANLAKHIETIEQYGLPFVVAINRFVGDSDAELQALEAWCTANSVSYSLTEVWEKGGNGGLDLADKVVNAIDEHTGTYQPIYDQEQSIEEKVTAIVRKIYGGKSVEFTSKARKQLNEFKQHGWDKYPVCMAKTQYSLSDDAMLVGRPEGFVITIREFVPKMGAGFIVALTGDVMTMPGLPKHPAALDMDVDNTGRISGLF